MSKYDVTVTTTAPLIPGEYVEGTSVGRHARSGRVAYRATWGGVYVKTAPSEHTGEPVHWFRDGHINGIPQTIHTIPVDQFQVG